MVVMVGKMKVIAGLLVLVMVTALMGCSKPQTDPKEANSNKDDGDKKKIGVIQIVEHPALDGAREGFLKALEDNGFGEDRVEITYQNAQGDIPTTHTIAAGFVSDKVDMIFAIATPSAQAAYNATKDIPILITAVTDPVAAGLIKSMENSENNVTGTSDLTPMDKQFELLKVLYPETKKVGIVYNTGEANSEIQVNMAKDLSNKYGFSIVEKGVSSVNEVAQALDSLLKDVDVIYTPTDNMIANAMTLVSTKSMEKGIPVIAAEEGQVTNGALATEGINYYELGYQTGEMAVEVLNGKEPKSIPLSTLEKTELIINNDTVQKLGITLPEELVKRGRMIENSGK